MLQSGRLALTLNDGRLNMIDGKTKKVLAVDYLIEGISENRSINTEETSEKIEITTRTENLEVVQSYVSGEDGTIYETVTIRNIGGDTLDTSGFRCGFLREFETADNGIHVCSVPFRYSTVDGELCDYKWNIFTKKLHLYCTMRNPFYALEDSHIGGAEAWAIYDGDSVLSVAKYNSEDIEWSLIEAKDPLTMYFGGAGIYKLGDPEAACTLAPGESYTFGVTRYKVMDGDYRSAYADYREFTEKCGHKLIEGYNPRIYWNELYNNPYWYSIPISEAFWHEDFSEYMDKMYNLCDMEKEAENAHEYSCETLYLDPGWDVSFSSNIWDERRMGKMKDFTRNIKEKYDLNLALHTPVAPWTSNASYDVSMRRVGEDGEILPNLCAVSKQYADEKVKRLIELYNNGAEFLMFDGSWYEGPCYCPDHGHSVPSTRKEHCEAIRDISRRVHEACPGVIIEQHDMITGPGTPRYLPIYFMNGEQGDPDEIWGFEFMNEPFEDLISRRAFALYYYNLAYSVPLYLHIDLRKDNETNMVFWWFASTCRHLGFGGIHPSEKVRELQKKSCKIFRENKRFFARGEFYGVNECVHLHTLREENATLVNCFHLECYDETMQYTVTSEQAGLEPGKQVTFTEDMPAFSHAAYIINWENQKVTRIV